MTQFFFRSCFNIFVTNNIKKQIYCFSFILKDILSFRFCYYCTGCKFCSNCYNFIWSPVFWQRIFHYSKSFYEIHIKIFILAIQVVLLCNFWVICFMLLGFYVFHVISTWQYSPCQQSLLFHLPLEFLQWNLFYNVVPSEGFK